MTTQVLFVQGAGDDTFERWDSRLVSSLRRQLGKEFDVLYPPMPDPGNPKPDAWISAIKREFSRLRDGDVLVGHSFGGTMLIHALAARTAALNAGALILLASPFFGDGGWEGKDMQLPDRLSDRLPSSLPVRIYHGTRDDTVPISHMALLANALPRAAATSVPDADHQFNDDLSAVAADIRGVVKAAGNRRAKHVGTRERLDSATS